MERFTNRIIQGHTLKQRIGIIFCGYGTVDLIDRSLSPWLSLRMNPDYDIKICAVSVKFAGFEGEDDGTCGRLHWYKENREIDYLLHGMCNIPETQARGMALTYLKQQGCDIIVQFDSDEVTDTESLKRMLVFVNQNPWTQWFRFSYRNLVLNESTWLAEPFTPPRVHRVIAPNGYSAHSFSGDNDICYSHHIVRNLMPQDAFASQVIPPQVFSPLHYSWLNNERSRLKVLYQNRRWNHCSFSWDDSQGGLIFNPALPRPKIISEIS